MSLRSVIGSTRLVCLLGLLAPASAVVAQVDYHRADQIRVAARHLRNYPDWIGFLGLGSPRFLADSTRFWYSVETARGREFVLVDPARLTRRNLFDNGRLAAAMSVAGDTAFQPTKLPFRTFEFTNSEQSIAFRVGTKRYECDLTQYRCVKGDTLSTDTPAWAVPSPDKRWEAYVDRGNLWVRRAAVAGAARDSVQLTTDGIPGYQYGLVSPETPPADTTARRRPTLAWSPDSRRIAIMRLDERRVGRMPIYSSTAIRPKLFLYPMAVPEDSVLTTAELHLVDVAAKTVTKVALPPQPNRTFGWTEADQVQWAPGSDRVFLTVAARANKKVELFWVEPATGVPHRVVAESTSTFLENASGVFTGNWRILAGGKEALWWSERDGWGHLYRYSDQGQVLGQLTSGSWLVDRVRQVDPVSGQIFFVAAGRDSTNPYHGQYWRINADGSAPTLLTPEPGQHLIYPIPTGKYFIDVHSRTDLPPVVTLRSTLDGRKALALETADPTQLLAAGWRPPTPFTAKARDGQTDLHGLIYWPSRMDTTKSYPVIDHIYPGPQVGSVFNWGYTVDGNNSALAELGFVVVQVNSLGTPTRSKAFHDFYYGNMGDNGIADHVAVIKQLGARYRFLDLDRVGIYGVSGGGFSSTGAILRFPDFFKVAVSIAGNHDNRSYTSDWGEKYQGRFKKDSATGRDNFESQANYLLAGNLKGKLFLIHGDMDTNVHPAQTMRLVDALVKAEKDFDLLLLPDVGHAYPDYAIRRSWDYFVRWLLGQEPPNGYRMIQETP